MNDTHLTIDGVGKTFDAHVALANIDLAVRRGEFVCLLGPSGCGKTTLLRIIAGFETATTGCLILDGADITSLPPHKREFGMVFQSLALFPHMSVAENIAYGLKVRGASAVERRARVDELLHVVKLPTIADRPVSSLSGGQRQRVAIARALAVRPKLFLLDEPLSALDAQLRESMQIELRMLQQSFGITTIFVTHDQHEAMVLADTLVVLKEGRVQQTGTPTEVYRRPANTFIAEFLGAANRIAGTVRDGGTIDALGIGLAIPSGLPPGARVDITLRAEDIRLEEPGLAPGAPTGEIEFVRDLGAMSEVIVRCGEERLRCRLPERRISVADYGTRVALVIDPAHCSAFPATLD